jgi:spoIIIJ-associated protein
VKKNRTSVYLEPMNPYERRIIHSALQDDPFVTTHSEGEEPDRKVVVTLKKDADLDALERKYGERRMRGARGSYRSGRGGRNDRRSSYRRHDGNRGDNRYPEEAGNEAEYKEESASFNDGASENTFMDSSEE